MIPYLSDEDFANLRKKVRVAIRENLEFYQMFQDLQFYELRDILWECFKGDYLKLRKQDILGALCRIHNFPCEEKPFII